MPIPAPDPTPGQPLAALAFATQMLAVIQSQLQQLGGAQSATIDGQTISVTDLNKSHQYWQRRVNILSGAKPRAARIRIGSCTPNLTGLPGP